ncbi:hypothetical protein D9M68_404960 [compost metagenome]
MIPVRENLVLVRQIGATGVNEIDARQMVFRGDLLRPEVLLHRQRIVGTAFDRRIVADDHAFAARHPADARDQSGRRRIAIVHAVRGRHADFEERRCGIDEIGHPVARQKLAAADMALARGIAAAAGRKLHGLLDRHDRLGHGRLIGPERFGGR